MHDVDKTVFHLTYSRPHKSCTCPEAGEDLTHTKVDTVLSKSSTYCPVLVFFPYNLLIKNRCKVFEEKVVQHNEIAQNCFQLDNDY